MAAVPIVTDSVSDVESVAIAPSTGPVAMIVATVVPITISTPRLPPVGILRAGPVVVATFNTSKRPPVTIEVTSVVVASAAVAIAITTVAVQVAEIICPIAIGRAELVAVPATSVTVAVNSGAVATASQGFISPCEAIALITSGNG
jgi:hypothetical protein